MSWKDKPASQKLLKLGKAALDHGLPRTQNTDVWLGAGLAMYDLMTSQLFAKNGAAKAANLAVRLADATIAKFSQPVHVDCKAGCAFCCRSLVSVTAPEAFLVLELLALKSRAGNPAPKKEATHCVFLADGRCSVYSARPINCRRTLSGSVRACETAFTSETVGLAHLLTEPLQKGVYVRGLLMAAIAATGRTPTFYELERSVTVLEGDATAQEKWLAGQDPLSNIQADTEKRCFGRLHRGLARPHPSSRPCLSANERLAVLALLLTPEWRWSSPPANRPARAP